MPPLRVLKISGSPHEMGFQHGRMVTDAIRELAEERLCLSTEEAWTGRTISREEALAVAQACLPAHHDYAPELMAELEGIGQATGLSMEELLIANGFTDFVDIIYNLDQNRVLPKYANTDCTTFMVDANISKEGHGFMGQTWDMHATAYPFVTLLRGEPEHAPKFVALTVTGCVGMIGMNEAGIAIGINNLMTTDGQPGVMWPFVVRKALMQDNLDDALRCITSAPLAGGHNYVLMDKNSDGYNVEASSSRCIVESFTEDARAHANRCLHPRMTHIERGLTPELEDDSDTRMNRANWLLTERPITPHRLMAITADRSDGEYSICAMSEAPYFSETCGAAIMRPGTREFWGVWGLPNRNNFERFVV